MSQRHAPTIRRFRTAFAIAIAAAIAHLPTIAWPGQAGALLWSPSAVFVPEPPRSLQQQQPPDSICELAVVDRSGVRSFTCMACHDGTVGRATEYRGGGGWEGMAGAPDGNSSHPVDMNYEVARRRRPGFLRPAAELPDALVLAKGLVTCATCHEGASTHLGRTAMTMDGSAMCLACHVY